MSSCILLKLFICNRFRNLILFEIQGNANVLPAGGSPLRSLLDLYTPHKSANKLSCKPLRTAALIDHALQTRCIGQVRFSHVQTPAQRSRLFFQTMQRGIKAVRRNSARCTVQVERRNRILRA